MPVFRALIRCVACAALAGAAYGQQTVQITGGSRFHMGKQPPEQAPVIGTGLISGTVVNAQSQEPVKKARVMLNGAANLTAITDSSGMFTFRALPAGAYFVNASHEDFYQNPLLTNTTQISLTDGEEKHEVQIKLAPGGAITGRVVDEDGEPVGRCNISALKSERQSGGRQMPMMRGGDSTGSDGVYHLHGLQQGRYQLRARCNETFPAPHGFMKRNDPGTPREGYAPAVYAQGDGQGATSGLRVLSGQDLTGIDFHVARAPLYTLRIAVEGDFQQQPNIMIESRGDEGDNWPYTPVRGNQGENSFTYSYLPAGSYTVTALTFGKDQAAEAHQDVEIGKTPVTDINLILIAAAKVKGTVEWEDATQAVEHMGLSFLPRTGNFRGPVPQGEIGKDGAVELNAIPGHYRLTWNGPGYLKRFAVGGQEADCSDFIVGPGSEFHILVGTKTGKLAVDIGGQPRAGQIISGVVIPESGDLQGMPWAIAMADVTTGRAEFPNVAPGKYKLVVIPTQNPWTMMNSPELMKALAAHGSAVEVTEGSDQHISAAPISADELQKIIEAQE